MIQNQVAIDLMKKVDNFANDILKDVNAKNYYLSNTLSSITTASTENINLDKSIEDIKRAKGNKSKISKIINSLNKEQEKIKRDNITLELELERVNDIIKLLKDKYSEGESLKSTIKDNINKGLTAEESIFYDENISGPLDRKMIELKQMLTVKGQTIRSISIIQKNNKATIQSIDNIKNATLL